MAPQPTHVGATILENLSQLVEYVWFVVIAVVGFMFKKLFNHDAKLSEHDTSIALLRQQGEARKEQQDAMIREMRDHHAEQMGVLHKLSQEK